MFYNIEYFLYGVRQTGKSYTLYQQMQQQLNEGIPVENLVYINFDDERLHGMSADQLDLILQANYSVRDIRPTFFFDEIQNVVGWENFARRLANQKYQVYITGKLLKTIQVDGNSAEISISDFAAGIYMVQVHTENGTVTRKVVK